MIIKSDFPNGIQANTQKNCSEYDQRWPILDLTELEGESRQSHISLIKNYNGEADSVSYEWNNIFQIFLFNSSFSAQQLPSMVVYSYQDTKEIKASATHCINGNIRYFRKPIKMYKQK